MGLKKSAIRDQFGYVIGYECVQKGIKILLCDNREADKIIVKHHYSHKSTNQRQFSFLVYWNNAVHGALSLGPGIRPNKKGEFEKHEVKEFDRMWLSDDMPKYSETITLSLLHNFLRVVMPKLKALISYADTSVGNKGTIYKAANYKLLSELKADFYVLPDGERIHPITMWHRHGTRVFSFLQTLYPGIKKAEGKQLKFIYYIR